MRNAIRVCLCGVLAVPMLAQAGPGVWTSEGPYGGQVFELLIDPAAPGVLYLSTRGEIVKSVDGGSSWSRAMNGLQSTSTSAVLMDRERPQRLYVVDSSGRLMRTTDGAATWTPTGYNPGAAQVSVRAFADVPTVARNGQFYFIGFDVPANTWGAYRTTDDGATFTRLPGLSPATDRRLSSIVVSPTNPDLLLVAVDAFSIPAGAPSEPLIYRSTDAGATWTAVLSTVVDPAFQQFVGVGEIRFGVGSTVYARADGGAAVRVSTNAGLTWSDSLATVGAGVTLEAIAPHPTLPGTLFLGTTAGVYVATGADTGTPTLSGPSTSLTPNASLTDGGTPPRSIQATISRIVTAPNFPAPGSAIWALSDYAGLWRSTDGGSSWVGGDSVNFGYSAVNVRAIEVHPHPAGSGVPAGSTRIYAGLGDAFFSSQALYRSNNNGGAWPASNNGLRAGQIRALAIDPTTTLSLASTVIYAAGRNPNAGFAPIPDVANTRRGRNGGIYKSIDGGANWTTIDSGLPTRTDAGVTFADVGTVRALVLDPRSCSSGPSPGPTGPLCTAANGPLRTVYATATGLFNGTSFSHRIVRSTDGGANWAARDTGLPLDVTSPGSRQAVTPVPLVLDPTNSNVLYTGTFLGYSSSAVPPPPPTIANGVFKSVDGGATWSLSSTGLPLFPGSTQTHGDVLALGISARNPQVLWAAVAFVQLDRNLTSLYRSTDGGATWSEARAGIPPGLDIRAITVNTPSDPTLSEAVYVAGAGTPANPGAVYRSTDGGLTWASISIGLPADSALAVTTDPRDRRRVLAGTNLGVWELTQLSDIDGDGAPDVQEGNAPNGGDGNGDGQPDALQGDVGSTIVLLNRRQPAGFLSCDGQFTSEIINDAQCPQARDVQQIDVAALAPDPIANGNGRSYRYPLSGVRFEIPQCQQATVEITFHQAGFLPGTCPDFDDFQWSFRFYGPQVPGDSSTFGWYDLGSRAVRVGPKTWRLTLDAGQFGSYRPNDPNNAANNAILFVGAPALSGDRILRSGFETGEN